MPAVTISRFRRPGRVCLAVLCLLAVALPAPGQQVPAAPEDAPHNVEAAREELQAIEASITLSRERAEEMRAEISEMEGDRARQNAALIAAAQRVKLAEIETAAAEERLAGLIADEKAIRARLDGADANVSGLLAALQRVTRAPPPVLLVSPEDAVSSARAGILLAAVLPQLRQRAGAVAGDLQALMQTRQSAEAEEDVLRANLATLFEEQLRTATLIEARRRGAQRVGSALEAEQAEAAALAERAQSLGELIDKLNGMNALPGPAEEADPSWADLGRTEILAAFADTDRTGPAVPFPAARGYLTLPASGVVTGKFGSDDGFGGVAQGVSLVTRAEAQVVAPADGWVMYKGPYLNYGQIIILNPGNGYSILLAGLAKTNVALGQFVLMGEPVGFMGSRTIGQAVTTNAGVSRPTLYIELRNQDTPLDPLTWWADPNDEIKSG